ncbi:MAG: rhomboid family intramembrane serine protease [Phycisphaerae bacterium]|jgi:membrane associated rhomboid family serine protease
MIIPWKVDVPQEKLPVMNWLLIASIIGAFFLQSYQIENHITIKVSNKNSSASAADSNTASTSKQKSLSVEEIKKQILQKMKERNWVYPYERYILKGWELRGMVGHMWLHGGWLHLIGNMIFLWIFGNAICAKFGNIAYLPIFIVLGVFAAMGHLIFNGGPALGASGAINGIVGMFLVLFPLNTISFLWLMFPFSLWWNRYAFEVSSFWMVLYWLAWDIFGAIVGGDNVAYFAHFGGFAAGVVITLILLKMKIIKTARYEKSLLDLLAERRAIVQPVTPYTHKALMLEYTVEPQPLAVNISPTEAAVKIQPPVQPLLSMEDFLKIDSPIPESQSAEQATAQDNDGFVRFYCDCGKRCKIPIKYAGQNGKCPKCGRKIKIPDN